MEPTAPDVEDVASPCIDVCRLDRNYQYCIGCLRTLDEIKRWSGMTNAEKLTVVTELAERRATQPSSVATR